MPEASKKAVLVSQAGEIDGDSQKGLKELKQHVPFFCLVDNVTDLHVKCPVFGLQRAICGLFCKEKEIFSRPPD